MSKFQRLQALVREESKDNEKIMFVLQKMKDSCQSEKLVMKDPYNVARMLSLIADIERDRANFDEASVYIQRSIQIRKQFLKSLDENINSAQHIIVIEALFSQGLIECARQNSKVARDLFSFILASIKNKEVNGLSPSFDLKKKKKKPDSFGVFLGMIRLYRFRCAPRKVQQHVF